MTLPTDAPLLAALEAQYRQLDALLFRLESARANLIPPKATFWFGAARLAYDQAMTAMSGTVEAGIAAVRSARDRTASAVYEVQYRG